MMVLLILAATAAQHAPDPQISGNWLLGVIGAIFSGAALVLGKYWGRTAERQERTVTISGQPLQYTNVPGVASLNDITQLTARIDRIEDDVRELRTDQAAQFKDLLEAGSSRETRLMEKMDSIAREWHRRLDDLFPNKPRTGR
jgi:hypothetical protein